jgi:hypothetical protein
MKPTSEHQTMTRIEFITWFNTLVMIRDHSLRNALSVRFARGCRFVEQITL